MPADVLTHPWKYAADPFPIVERLYYVGNRDVSCHLLDTGDGLILLDTAYPQTVYLLLESVRRLGFDPADIRYIVHNHAHYDHLGGTRAVVELTGAKTFLGRPDVPLIHDRPELTWAAEYGVEFHEAFRVDVPLEDGDTVELGDARIECVRIPGHTPGCMAYFFEVRDGGRRLRAGMHGGPGRNTLTDEYLARYALPPTVRQDYLGSLRRLKEQHVDVMLGAHPDQNDTFGRAARKTQGRNPFVDPEAWPRFLEELQARFHQEFPGV